MAALKVPTRFASFFLRANKPKVVLGAPSSTTPISSSDSATLTDSGSVAAFVPKSDSDSGALTQNQSVAVTLVTATDTFTLQDDPDNSTSITFVAAGSSAGSSAPSFTVNLPAGIQVDDLIIAQLFLSGSSGTHSDYYPITGPAGWTVEDEAGAAGNNGRVLFAWKRADGTESSTSVTFTPSTTGSVDCRSRSAVYRGANWDGGPFDGGSAWGEEISYSGDNPQPGPVTTTLANQLQIVLSFTFGGFVGSGDHFIPSSTHAHSRYDDYFTSGFTGINQNLCDVPMGSPAPHTVIGTWGGLGTGKAMGWVTRVIKTKSPGCSVEIVVFDVSDSATSSSTESVTATGSGTVVAKSDSDSASVTDAGSVPTIADAEVAYLSETESVTPLTDTTKSDSDSATFTDSEAVVSTPAVNSSDTFTLTDTPSVSTITDSNYTDSDRFVLAETYSLLVMTSSSDGGTLSENDSTAGNGVVATPVRRHGHHPHHQT